jgi:hypothetical protein
VLKHATKHTLNRCKQLQEMKNLSLILLFILSQNILSQNRMKITLNNGETKTGIFKIKKSSLGFPSKARFTSKKGNYKIDNIKNVVIYSETDSIFLKVIPTKKYLNSKTKNKLAQIGFIGKKIELYYVSEIIYSGGTVGFFITTNGYFEKYLKKKNDDIAYNMGYIYGAGQRGIKKRVRDYFKDCQKLIEKIENNEIPKKETIKIAHFYENKCE